MIEPHVNFDFDEVDERLAPPSPIPQYDFSGIAEVNRPVWEWIYQPPCKDVDGFLCRSIVACWIFVPALRECTMTEMAGRFGKKKQSLGRWVDDFKVTFPSLSKLQHFKTR